MRLHFRLISMWLPLTLAIFTLGTFGHGLGASGVRTYESNGLSFQYPTDLKPMSPTSTKQIQGMLNQQLQGMGNTQVSVIALDVLLHLPAFRVMIAKERFRTKPTPSYLIDERKHFLSEAKQRGVIKSYGTIKETKIGGHVAIEFQDLDKGPQGYGSRVRILCGKDTWNFTFTGSSQKAHEQYQSHIQHIMNTIAISQAC